MTTPAPINLTAAAALALSLALAGCSGGGDGAQTQETTGDQATNQSAEASPDGPAEDADLSQENPTLTPEEAITTARDEAGDGTVHAIELDYDQREGAWQYEVKILVGTTDHDIEVDAESGDVVNVEEDETEDTEEAIDLSAPMTWDEAHKLTSAQGTGRLTGWKLESDDDRIEYQFDYDDNGQEREVSVDVETKRVTVDD